nr:major centromere autoantigen B-like [Rhipicephalus microplus]
MADQYCSSAAEEEDYMAAEAEKDAEGNLDGAVDTEELKGVKEEIVEEKAEESEEGEGEAEETERWDEEVGEHDSEAIDKSQDLKEAVEFRDREKVADADAGEDCVEGEAAENWE